MATPQGSNEEIIACSVTSPYAVTTFQILYSKRYIDELVLDKVELENTSLEDKKRSLMGAIEKTVSDDERKLHELATVLDQFKETKSVADSIMIDYSELIIVFGVWIVL
jgi:hypothetical protein